MRMAAQCCPDLFAVPPLWTPVSTSINSHNIAQHTYRLAFSDSQIIGAARTPLNAAARTMGWNIMCEFNVEEKVVNYGLAHLYKSDERPILISIGRGTVMDQRSQIMKQSVKVFFDQATWTLTYVVYDEDSRDAIIIDPVWDYDQASSRLSNISAKDVAEFVKEGNLRVHYILETHAHADHVSGSQVLKELFPQALVGIGANITLVQKVFKDVFGLDASFPTDGRQFDILLSEGQVLKAGTLEIKTLFTPGHTPACASYVIGESVFTGDALFMPDYGTGRCDFPAGSAADLYDSVHEKLYKLPDHYQVFVGHDYQPNGRNMLYQSTIGHEKAQNIQLNATTTREDFVQFRTNRDRSLAAPRLLLPSVQVNIDAGHLPEAAENGTSYLRIPLRR